MKIAKRLLILAATVIMLCVVSVVAAAHSDFDEDYYPWCEADHTMQTIPGKAPTCTESGLTDYEICTSCLLVPYVPQEIPALGHNFGYWLVEISPTISRTGLNYKICDICSETITKETPAINYRPGDFDNNGRTTAADARSALRFSVGLDQPTDFYIQIGDLNGDGILTVVDARILLRIAVGLEEFIAPALPDDVNVI